MMTEVNDAALRVTLLVFFAFKFVVYLECAFANQEETTEEENKVATRKSVAGDGEPGFCQTYDPVDGKQEQDAHAHGQREADHSCPGTLRLWQFAGENRDENDVIDAKNDFERGQGEQRRPNSWVRNPVHKLLLKGPIDCKGSYVN